MSIILNYYRDGAPFNSARWAEVENLFDYRSENSTLMPASGTSEDVTRPLCQLTHVFLIVL
jgi:hypothetical protein